MKAGAVKAGIRAEVTAGALPLVLAFWGASALAGRSDCASATTAASTMLVKNTPRRQHIGGMIAEECYVGPIEDARA